jgi:DNA ligase 1
MNEMEGKLYKKLFKLNTDGSTQVWELWHNDNSYWSVTSKLGGKEIINEPTMVIPKVNRNMIDQMSLELNSKVLEKIKKKYVDNVDNIHTADDKLQGYSVMLAHKYNEQKSKIKFPCSLQPKLDGIRCPTTKDGMFSRGREKFSSCQHIWKELQDFFNKYPDARLDGELYTHEYKEDFEKICHAVKKTSEKATPEDIKFQQKIKYFVYDAPRIADKDESNSFVERFTIATDLLKGYKNIVMVETLHNISTEEQITAHKERWIQDGYEGAMVRNTFSEYEGKRSYNLQKVKDFDENEYEIIGINEGTGNYAGHIGSFILKIGDKTFDAKLDGSKDRLKYLFEHQKECIGKMATIRHQKFSTYGIPRFPVMKAIRGLKNQSDWL